MSANRLQIAKPSLPRPMYARHTGATGPAQTSVRRAGPAGVGSGGVGWSSGAGDGVSRAVLGASVLPGASGIEAPQDHEKIRTRVFENVSVLGASGIEAPSSKPVPDHRPAAYPMLAGFQVAQFQPMLAGYGRFYLTRILTRI